jgi:hypothetical protein
MGSNIDITANHAGGNIKVISIQNDYISLEQDLRDTPKWFYWNFAAVASGRTVRFEFVNDKVVGPWGPAISVDGATWKWLGPSSEITRASFPYTFPTERKKIYFSFAIPYQLHHFEQFYARHSTRENVVREVLTLSEQLRPVPLLRLGNPHADRHIIFTARHHACESTASYLVEGLLDYLLRFSPSTLLERYLIHYIPFVDIDGVENGDQGKNRIPHDHNRDYRSDPLYRSTAALMDYVRPLNIEAAIDFHCPFKWGKRHDHPHFVKQLSPVKERIESLSRLLERFSGERADSDAIRYSSGSDLEMNKEWNTPDSPSCSHYFRQTGVPLACTFEFPYFGLDQVYQAENMKRFGEDFARALEIYLL